MVRTRRETIRNLPSSPADWSVTTRPRSSTPTAPSDFMKSRLRPGLILATLLYLLSTLPAWAAPGGLPLNVKPDYTANNDTLTWSLLGVLGLTLGMVTACGLGIYRQFKRSTPETELLEEMKRQAREPGPIKIPPAAPGSSRDTWERPADWWKDPQD